MTDQDSVGELMTEAWARAMRALKRGDRVTAEVEWSEALSWAKRVHGPGPYELCWRAMIVYQRASNLALLHRLEHPSGDRPAITARAMWLELIDTAMNIDREARAVFQELHGFDVTEAAAVARRELVTLDDLRGSRERAQEPLGELLHPNLDQTGGQAPRR